MHKKYFTYLLACAAWFPLGMQAQQLETKQPIVDCGQILFRRPVAIEFTVKNKSDKALTIQKVRTDCGSFRKTGRPLYQQ